MMIETQPISTKPLVEEKKENKFIYLYIIAFCLATIQFFSPIIVPSSILYYIYYALFSYSAAFVIVSYKESHHNFFTLPISLVLLAQLIAIFSCTYSWHQSLVGSILATSLNMSYILFFILVIHHFSIADTEKIIITCGGLYILIFMVSFVIYPRTFITWEVTYGDERGFQRILVNGIGFLFLFSFYSLKNYITTQKRVWLFIYLVTFVTILMTLTRTLIICSTAFSFLYYIRGKKAFPVVIALLVVACLLYIVSQMNFYQILASETKSQATYVKDDIRRQATDYYLNNFSPNPIAKVLGNGDAYKDTEYLNYMLYLEKSFGYYETDIGYIGFYVKYGVLALLGYLVFLYRTLKVSVSEEYQYCKYFLYFIFAISVIIESPFSKSYIPAIVLAAYILSCKGAKKKLINEEADTRSFQ